MSTNYENFIIANAALMKCYEQVPASEFSALSKNEQLNLCKSEQDLVSRAIRAGHASFSSIITERINSLEAQSKEQ